ncbi:hypothetical protein ACLOJK_007729 [Asimina triloba]
MTVAACSRRKLAAPLLPADHLVTTVRRASRPPVAICASPLAAAASPWEVSLPLFPATRRHPAAIGDEGENGRCCCRRRCTPPPSAPPPWKMGFRIWDF